MAFNCSYNISSSGAVLEYLKEHTSLFNATQVIAECPGICSLSLGTWEPKGTGNLLLFVYLIMQAVSVSIFSFALFLIEPFVNSNAQLADGLRDLQESSVSFNKVFMAVTGYGVLEGMRSTPSIYTLNMVPAAISYEVQLWLLSIVFVYPKLPLARKTDLRTLSVVVVASLLLLNGYLLQSSAVWIDRSDKNLYDPLMDTLRECALQHANATKPYEFDLLKDSIEGIWFPLASWSLFSWNSLGWLVVIGLAYVHWICTSFTSRFTVSLPERQSAMLQKWLPTIDADRPVATDVVAVMLLAYVSYVRLTGTLFSYGVLTNICCLMLAALVYLTPRQSMLPTVRIGMPLVRRIIWLPFLFSIFIFKPYEGLERIVSVGNFFARGFCGTDIEWKLGKWEIVGICCAPISVGMNVYGLYRELSKNRKKMNEDKRISTKTPTSVAEKNQIPQEKP